MAAIKDVLSTAAEALHISLQAPTGPTTPYVTALGAMMKKGPDAAIFSNRAPPNKPPPVTRTAKSLWEQQQKKLRKAEETAANEKESQQIDSQKLDNSKNVVLEQLTTEVKKIKIGDGFNNRDRRVSVKGWVHRLRQQSNITFLVLRGGHRYMQCVLTGKLVSTIKALPEGKNAPDNHKLVADWWQVIGKAPSGDDAFTNQIAEASFMDTGFSHTDNRHLVIRGETSSAVLKVRAPLPRAFRAQFEEMSLTEVTPPCMVQTQVEGGSMLFTFDYYGQQAFLTQSSQLHLETCLPSLGDMFCVQEIFRAEKSHTRRHLSEYTHSEGELAFISFEELFEHLEELMCQRPFKRMDYKDAVAYLNEHEITKEDGSDHVVGDDISEAAERKMTDQGFTATPISSPPAPVSGPPRLHCSPC
ncbi:unnamed protein product [Tilletia laevis]|uniref:Aminoacyl-tRNA synthetase class II (D/K/N) domain-containing protein n=1 Tax=Tilletia laevis TaxID=157183 RepID=A0A9N8Q901_9BASI|nr:unnamed protein product [Tilletia laevis]